MTDRKIVGYDFVIDGYVTSATDRMPKVERMNCKSLSIYEKTRKAQAYKSTGKYKS